MVHNIQKIMFASERKKAKTLRRGGGRHCGDGQYITQYWEEEVLSEDKPFLS